MSATAAAVLLLVAALSTGARADILSKGFLTGEIPEYHVADPAAPAVTAKNLFESERFWPYRAALVKSWGGLPSGAVGVLIRMDSSEQARIDFGRDGVHELPPSATDLVARANAIRLGKEEKDAPNFIMAVGPRLLDPASVKPRAFPFEDSARGRTFLCVFADPWRMEFGRIVTELAPFRDKPGLVTVLFPQSRRPDLQVAGQLRAMKWTPPYVVSHLSEPYTATLLREGTTVPAVLLQTAEGRVLLESRWSGEVAAKLASIIDAPVAEVAAPHAESELR